MLRLTTEIITNQIKRNRHYNSEAFEKHRKMWIAKLALYGASKSETHISFPCSIVLKTLKTIPKILKTKELLEAPVLLLDLRQEAMQKRSKTPQVF